MGLAPTKRTTDLRKGLSDRAIYWIDVPQAGGWRTLWKPDDSRDIYCYFDENRLGDTELVVSHLTPAQVLAATTVVRCRDCKHCRKSFDGRGVVCVLRSLHHFYTDPDGYCSNGKLRDLPSTGSAGGQAKGLYQREEIERLKQEITELRNLIELMRSCPGDKGECDECRRLNDGCEVERLSRDHGIEVGE